MREKFSSSPLLPSIIFWICLLLLLLAIFYAASVLFKKIASKQAPSSSSEGYDFEVYIAALLEESGFDSAEVTTKSNDYGADVLAQRDGVKFAIQCKFYASPVGVSAVQQVVSAKEYYHCHVGIVATNNRFTENAHKLAEKTNTLLWDGHHLKKMEEDLH